MNTTVQPVLLSKKGFKELKKQIAHLEQSQKRLIADLRDIDKTTGRDERLLRIEKLATLEGVEAELQEKRFVLSNAKPLPTKRKRLQVALGSVVDLIDQQGRLFRYTIVDSIEANPSDGRISAASPLGQRLLGKALNETVEWSSNLRTNRLQLVGIS